VVIPQQLGVGVRGGVELVAVALKIEYTNAVANNVAGLFAQDDVENAHNEYNRDKAQEAIIAAAHKNPRLIKLAITHESISK
jgi:hypothetical protein